MFRSLVTIARDIRKAPKINMGPRLHPRIGAGIEHLLKKAFSELGIVLENGDAGESVICPSVHGFLIALFENAKIALFGAIVILVAVETIGVVECFVGWALWFGHAALDSNYFGGTNAWTLGKFDVRQPFVFACRIDGFHHLREVESHRLALLLINRELLGEIRRQNEACEQCVSHALRFSRQSGLYGFDEGFGSEQQEIGFIRGVERWRALRIIL